MPRMIKVYDEGETVLIKAVVSQVHIGKDKVTYSLKDATTGTPYTNRFSDKDIIPCETEEEVSTEEEKSEE